MSRTDLQGQKSKNLNLIKDERHQDPAIMSPPLTVVLRDVCRHKTEILSVLPELFTRETYADVTFFCKGGTSLKSHRLLLGAVSPFLQALFKEQGFRDMIEVSLPDFDLDDVDNLLRYVYDGFIRLDEAETHRFKVLKNTLGLQTATVITKLRDDCDESVEEIFDEFVLPMHNSTEVLTEIESKSTGQKRKISLSENSSSSKFLKVDSHSEQNKRDEKEQNIVDQSNPQAGPSTECTPKLKKNKGPAPLLVPIENFKKVVQTIEERKATRNLESVVQKCVDRLFCKEHNNIMQDVLERFKSVFKQDEEKQGTSSCARNSENQEIEEDIDSDASTVSLENFPNEEQNIRNAVTSASTSVAHSSPILTNTLIRNPEFFQARRGYINTKQSSSLQSSSLKQDQATPSPVKQLTSSGKPTRKPLETERKQKKAQLSSRKLFPKEVIPKQSLSLSNSSTNSVIDTPHPVKQYSPSEKTRKFQLAETNEKEKLISAPVLGNQTVQEGVQGQIPPMQTAQVLQVPSGSSVNAVPPSKNVSLASYTYQPGVDPSRSLILSAASMKNTVSPVTCAPPASTCYTMDSPAATSLIMTKLATSAVPTSAAAIASSQSVSTVHIPAPLSSAGIVTTPDQPVASQTVASSLSSVCSTASSRQAYQKGNSSTSMPLHATLMSNTTASTSVTSSTKSKLVTAAAATPAAATASSQSVSTVYIPAALSAHINGNLSTSMPPQATFMGTIGSNLGVPPLAPSSNLGVPPLVPMDTINGSNVPRKPKIYYVVGSLQSSGQEVVKK